MPSFREKARLAAKATQAFGASACFVVFSSFVLSENAFAQAAATAQPSPLLQAVPLIFIVGVMYFLVLRPQMRKQKEHQSFVSTLKRGDEVLTSGGILGRIEGLTDLYATVEIAPNVRIKILRTQIASNTSSVMASGGTSNEVKT